VTHRKTEKERRFADGRGGVEEREGAKSYDGEKTWSCIVLYSALNSTLFQVRYRYGGRANIIIFVTLFLPSYVTQTVF
jgi:hypothetical protein